MALPTQIDERLTAVGARAADVEERFVRGTGPGGQKINKTSQFPQFLKAHETSVR